jgi:hypothetical protein
MPTLCPTCQREIAPEDVNVAQNVAFCRGCSTPHALSALAPGAEGTPTTAEAFVGHEGFTDADATVDPANPPAGAWYRDDGVEMRVGATMRSGGAGGFMLVFSGFWNLITWILILGFLVAGSGQGGPDWFVFLFFVPFVAIGLGTGWLALVYMVGRTEVKIRHDRGEAFVGVGAIGWRRAFTPADVTGVRVAKASWTQNNQSVWQILLTGPDIRFGSGLSPERRAFVAGALRRALGV